jgi:hypothetical protein
MKVPKAATIKVETQATQIDNWVANHAWLSKRGFS